MKLWVALTDSEWAGYLASLAPLDEVNFWQPSALRRPAKLEPGAPVLFKLHAAAGGAIVGGAFFVDYLALPINLAWDTFGTKNGAPSLADVVTRVSRYRRYPVEPTSFDIGCSILSSPFFLDEGEWIRSPADWKLPTQQGKSYETDDGGEGARLWLDVEARLVGRPPAEVPVVVDRYGKPTLVRPRLGQGGFRSVVIKAYERRCVVTGERTLPALEAAHIKPYSASGPHSPDNGLLLRRDLHALFDDGYVTVTPNLEFRVSRQIRDQFENGRDYYALDGKMVRAPIAEYPRASNEYLQWHNEVRFLG